MANTKNLKKGNPETEFRSGREAVESGKKGGQRSGTIRKLNADIKKLLQAALFEEYTEKTSGITQTGIDGIVKALITKALNSRDKEQLAAIKYIFFLLGVDRTEEEVKKIKAETDLIKAKVKAAASEQWDKYAAVGGENEGIK